MVKLLPLFVYGTARVGQPLHHVIEPAVKDTVIVTAPNMELMVPTNTIASFPYLVPRPHTPDERVWGDLLLVERNHHLMRLVGIEVLAGYTLEGIRIEHGVEGVPDFALAFLWRRSLDSLTSWGSPSWLSRNLATTR